MFKVLSAAIAAWLFVTLLGIQTWANEFVFAPEGAPASDTRPRPWLRVDPFPFSGEKPAPQTYPASEIGGGGGFHAPAYPSHQPAPVWTPGPSYIAPGGW